MENNLPLEKEIGGIFTNFPAFPDNIKEILVKIAPYGAILAAVFGVIGLLTVFGLGSIAAGIGALNYGGSGVLYYISMAVLAVMVFLYATAIKPLMNREKKGWDNLYYVEILSLITNLLSFSIVGFILSFVIGFWVLFQVKDKYH